MPTPTHDQVRAIGDFAMYHKWIVQFYKLPAFVAISSADLNLRAISTDLPKRTTDVSTTSIRGHEVHQAGISKYNGQINLTFVEDIKSSIGHFIHEWYEGCWESISGIQQLKQDYEGGVLLTPLDNYQKTRDVYKLVGVWPEDFDHGGQMDGSNSDSVKMQVTFRYDYYLLNP